MDNKGFKIICENCNSLFELKESLYFDSNYDINVETHVRHGEFSELYIYCKCGNEFNHK